MKPLAFIDVDGVLNRSVSNTVARRRGYITYRTDLLGFPLKVILDPNDRRRLQRLAEHFELAWGTTWEDEANHVIGQLIGISEKWPVAKNTGPSPSKAPGIRELANGRPFVWFDDEAGNEDRAYLAGTDHLIIDVADNHVTAEYSWEETGLTDLHIDRAIAWAKRKENNA